MGRVIYIGAILIGLAGPFLTGGAASAQEFNHVITVYASVPEQRGIYVDKAGHIIKVAGNTASNITPQVFSADNQTMPMNDSVQRQYDKFLKDHDYRLIAGKVYVLNQVITVDSAADSRTIKVDTANLTLGSAQNG